MRPAPPRTGLNRGTTDVRSALDYQDQFEIPPRIFVALGATDLGHLQQWLRDPEWTPDAATDPTTVALAGVAAGATVVGSAWLAHALGVSSSNVAKAAMVPIAPVAAVVTSGIAPILSKGGRVVAQAALETARDPALRAFIRLRAWSCVDEIRRLPSQPMLRLSGKNGRRGLVWCPPAATHENLDALLASSDKLLREKKVPIFGMADAEGFQWRIRTRKGWEPAKEPLVRTLLTP